MIKLSHKVSNSKCTKEELIENVIVVNTTPNDADNIIFILSKCFNLTPLEVKFQFKHSNVDLENSVKLIDKRNGEIYGLLIFCHFNITQGSPIDTINPELAKILQPIKQINGHSFILDERLRGLGFDRKMLNHSKNFIKQFKFIWCGVEKDLKSHNYWKRLGFAECVKFYDATFYIKDC